MLLKEGMIANHCKCMRRQLYVLKRTRYPFVILTVVVRSSSSTLADMLTPLKILNFLAQSSSGLIANGRVSHRPKCGWMVPDVCPIRLGRLLFLESTPRLEKRSSCV